FRINSEVFASAVTGSSPAIVDRALGHIEIDKLWDLIGADGELSDVLGTKGARATSKGAQERLLTLWRQRNQLAHGGDEEAALSESDLSDAIKFVLLLAKSLNSAVE